MTPPPPEQRWRPSDRALRYWAAIVVVVIGIICDATIPGTLGGTICTAIVGIGLVALVSMMFYDVGLTEDRDRERRQRRLEQQDEPPASANKPSPPTDHPTRGPLRPDRLHRPRRRSH